jgi:hypothetical protein
MEAFDGIKFALDSVDLYLDLQRLIIAFVVIFSLDRGCIFLGWFPESKSNTRYFTIHVFVNAYVTAVHFKVLQHTS